MHPLFSFKSARLALIAAFLSSAAYAQLLITGHLTGGFTNSAGPNDTIFNAPDGSSAWMRSGIPETGADLQTAIEFTQKNFVNVGGGLVADDIFTVTNGRTLLGSTATAASFDLNLTLTAPEARSGLLTSIAFTIENTPNGAGNVDDNYGLSWSSIAPFYYAGYQVQFEFVAPDSFWLEENTSGPVGQLYVSFVPVPEPSTYAAMGAALLLGVVGFRRFRRPPVTPA